MSTIVAMISTIRESLYEPVFKRAWPIWIGALAFAVTNILMATYARGLGVFPQMSMWGASILNAVGIEVEAPFAPYPITPVFLDLHSMINFGIILGVLATALIAREFKLRTDNWRGYAQGLLGGILMGWGTVMTPPCNVGGFGTSIMALSLSGFLMAMGLVPGAFIGALLLKWQSKRAISKIDFKDAPINVDTGRYQSSRRPLLGWLVFLLLFAAAIFYSVLDRADFAVLLLFGAVFGIIFQRSRLCFAAGFRDIFASRDTKLLRWILIAEMLGMVGFSILKFKGFIPVDHFVFPTGINSIVGGFVFGIGMVIAGGCGSGILWRSAEGYVRHWFAIIGGMLAAGSWVLLYGAKVGEGWLYGPKVFLPDVFGWTGALIAGGLMLVVFYIVLVLVEVKKSNG
ncbi:YeeE/YedE thiosulfate transporter family protein [Chloroflexota bacterium]